MRAFVPRPRHVSLRSASCGRRGLAAQIIELLRLTPECGYHGRADGSQRQGELDMLRATPSLAASLVCGLLALSPARLAQAQTLEDALVAAYTGNPTLQAERSKLRQTDELVPQAKAGWRPTVAVETGAGVEWI